MKNVVVTDCPRADLGEVGALAMVGVLRCPGRGTGARRQGARVPGCVPPGQLGLGPYGLRSVLSELGVKYVDYHSYQEAGL